MALLGAQLVITLVMVSVIQKLGPHFSLANWLLCRTGLMRYLYPTDTQLRQLANIPKDKGKPKRGGKRTDNDKVTVDTFHIPRSLDVQLETAKVISLDVIHLKYYTEYQWLVDFALYSFLVYAVTEMYSFWFPLQEEVNLSMLWCVLVIGFAFKLLSSLTLQYFRGEESVGERSTCIVTGFTYLFISMMVFIVNENVLELGFQNAYSSFNHSATKFLNNQGLSSTGPASEIVLKFFLALWSGLMGAIFTFPGLRMAKMHWDLLKYFKDQKLIQFLLNVNFALPFILVTLWIKPVSKDYLTVRVFSGMTEPLITVSTFDSLRLIAIIIAVIVRFSLMPWYLQAYLDMAYHRVENQKKEAGRTTNLELQKSIAAVFYYLCVVTLQYVAPLIICLYFAFMYKTLGGYSWVGFLQAPNNSTNFTLPNVPGYGAPDDAASIAKSAKEFHLALESLKSVFSTEVYRGLFGFATWWSCFVWFSSTSIGLIYQSYFAQS